MYSLDEKYSLIKSEILKTKSKNPIEILTGVMDKDFIDIHGPEHHFLDGAAFLVAFYNAGGDIDIDSALNDLLARALKMPGAMCGQWGVCGAVASLGAALAVINHTGPLSDNDYYKDNMEFTASTLLIMSKIGGPRCCKRNAFISISSAVKFIAKKYGVQMETSAVQCRYRGKNAQCIQTRCPYFRSEK